MKIIEKGKDQQGWTIETLCDGRGRGGKGCGAKLLVEEPDLYRTDVDSPGSDYSTPAIITYTCPGCGLENDIENVPGPVISRLPHRGAEKHRKRSYTQPVPVTNTTGEIYRLLNIISRAIIQVRSIPEVQHSNTCPIEDDTSYAPCNCGASARNAAKTQAIDGLKEAMKVPDGR